MKFAEARAALPDASYDRQLGALHGQCPKCGGRLEVGGDPGEARFACWGEECDEAMILAAAAAIVPGGNDSAASSWKPIDLGPVLASIAAGETVGPLPALLRRSDNVALLYPGCLHSIAAEPESGKSWLLQAESARLIEAGERALYLDFEDTEANVVTRLLALGATPAAIGDRFVYVRPAEAIQDGVTKHLLEYGPFALSVVDGVTEAMGLLGLEIASNDDIAKFRKRLARPFTRSGSAHCEIDHVVKDRESRGRYAIGGQHKLSGADVAYSVTAIDRPSRTRAGLLKLIVEKDRHGHVRAHEDPSKVIALLRIEPEDNGASVTVTLDPPDAAGADGTFRPTVLMDRVSLFLDENPGATRNEVRRGVKGKNDGKDTALTLLVDEGYVDRRPDGQAQRHHNLRRFINSTEPPSPNRAPTEPRPGWAAPSPRAPALTEGSGSGPGSNGHPTEPRAPRPLNAITADIETAA